jgi:hypothetical protein
MSARSEAFLPRSHFGGYMREKIYLTSEFERHRDGMKAYIKQNYGPLFELDFVIEEVPYLRDPTIHIKMRQFIGEIDDRLEKVMADAGRFRLDNENQMIGELVDCPICLTQGDKSPHYCQNGKLFVPVKI